MTPTYALDAPLARNPVIVVTVFGVLATLTTGLRLYALKLRRVRIGAPEILILVALLIVYIDIAIQYILSFKGGAGRHITEVDPQSVTITLKTILPLEALYGIVMGLVKTSMMLFFMRIFGTKRSFQISVGIVMTIVWLWAISVILETVLLCRPLAFNWDTTIPGGTCGDRNGTFVSAGVLNLVTDLMVMALPVPYIWKLQLSTAKKIALSLVFCMGLLVSVISIVRLSSLMAIDFNDITYSVQMGVMWTVLEPELAIICANMPLMKTVLARAFPGLFSTAQITYSVSNGQDFQRIHDPGAAIYPMNRLDHEPVNTKVSSGSNTSGSRPFRNKRDPDADLFMTTRTVDFESDEQRLTAPAGIGVSRQFDVKYDYNRS
ncbi:hypothetical protein BDW42DRAFT_172895 [Aspergillus taichungensis]|uniref:Rhodopsin domain-containing protein n=1 Tax=Aspergillus taichungensis TaxID=482145 RepID=A0A2J5HQM0_9EURO|nr:hypothetical protein BDW42DRAFT_172895 [Aspergillus taichungensis]